MSRLLVAFASLLLLSMPAFADPREEVFAAWERMVEAGSYRSTLVTESAGLRYEQVIEIVLPDRLSMRGGPAGEVVVTPEGAWMRPPEQAEWSEAPVSLRAMTQSLMGAEFIEQAKAGVQEVESLGAGEVDGQPTRRYRVRMTTTHFGVESKSVTLLDVDQASGRPLRQEIEAEAMGHLSRTVQGIEYLPELRIEPPVAVAPGP